MEAARVRGTATYRERIAIPSGATFQALLEDVSKADVAAEVIGQVTIEQPANPPIEFEIPYDPSRIDPRMRYSVRASISVAGRLMFTTVEHYPVLTGGAGDEVELLLRRTGDADHVATAPLENTYWKLTHLGGEPVIAAANQKEPHFILHPDDHRVSGSGGCNTFRGGYELNGEELTLGQMASTLMACLEGMETEAAFLKTLGLVGRWRIVGQRLELLDPAGVVLAQFEAVYL